MTPLSEPGVCEDDIDRFCLDVMPGLGRLAICLSDQLKEQEKQDFTGTNVSRVCSQELDKFRQNQTDNINLDLPLGKIIASRHTHLSMLCPLSSWVQQGGCNKVSDLKSQEVYPRCVYIIVTAVPGPSKASDNMLSFVAKVTMR